MSDVKQLALEAVEGRKEAEKRIPKVISENLEDYVKKIIEIFKISNSSEKSTVLVWQVKLYYYYRFEICPVMFSFEQDSNRFFNKVIFDCVGYENNESLKKYIENLEIPTSEAKNILKYFKENLAEYFETEESDNEYIIIKMKRKDASINSAS